MISKSGKAPSTQSKDNRAGREVEPGDSVQEQKEKGDNIQKNDDGMRHELLKRRVLWPALA